jgi:hypothetical protein
MGIPQQNYFWTKEGRGIDSIPSLAAELENMPDWVFQAHVNPEKNDFANWINDVFGEGWLAAKVRSAKTKSQMKMALKFISSRAEKAH